MSERINMFYLSPNTTGGWVTFTSHLIEAMIANNQTGVLRKIGNNTERKGRPFGYGKTYWNTSLEDAKKIVANEPSIIVAAAKKFRDTTDELLSLGARIVIHDPTELKNLPPVEFMQDQCVVIRKVGLNMLPDATFIRHPYKRMEAEVVPKVIQCVSTSRIDFDKHTDILLDANRLLPDDKKIDIRGFENRLYTKFKILPKYPEWVQSVTHYPREEDAAFNILQGAQYMADMSIIKGDGGGTQYTFLEAWDAGAVPIIHGDWVREDDDMDPMVNCLAVRDGGELAALLDDPPTEELRESLVKHGFTSLVRHHPAKIGLEYLKFMGMV